MLLLLVVVALLPAAGIQVYNAIDLHHRQEREVDRQAERLLDLVEAEHNRLIDGIRQVLATVRQTRFARNGEFDACQVFMDRVRPDYPEYIDFYLADGTGTVRCGTEARTTGTFIGDRFHFRQALATGAFTTGEYIARHPTGQAVLTFALPLGNPMGETVGIVAALLDARWLAAYLGTKPLPESAALIVADRNGTVIARVPELPGVVGTRLPDNFQPLLAGTRRETVEMPGLDRVTRVIAYSPVNAPPTGLFLSVGVDKAAAMAPIDRAMLASLGLIAGGLAFILAVLWLGSRRFLCRPVDNLVEATRRWRSGAHAARADTVQVGSEIAVLGKAFNDMATDLESQTKLREQVHDTALRMAEVLASTTDCVFDLDHDWRFTFVNQRAQDQIMEGRDVTGRVIWDVFPKAVGGIFWEQYHRAMGERIPVEFEGFSEYRQRWYAVRAFPSRQGLAVYFQDTTARRAAEERLREQEAQYRAIVETAVDAMVVIDEQGLIQSFNPAAERIFGYGAAEAVGRNIRMLMPEPYHAEHDGYLDHHRRTGERRIIGIGRQVEGRRKDGSTFPLDLSVAEWTVDDHRCFTGIMRDITARKRIETALEDALRRTTEILESIGDGFYAIDGDWRFSYANQRALEIFGRTREDLFGRPFFEAFPEVEGSPVHCNYREVMADRQPREFEALSPILNRWIAFSAYPQAGGCLCQ